MGNENIEQHYRPGLPEMPEQLRALPVERGYPVPWFVARIHGQYDFRIADQRKFVLAVKGRLCWICGQPLGVEFTFPIGPMCAINRTTAEPPSHDECAEWSARVCPFLIQKEAKRREAGRPDGIVRPPGEMIERQPGVVLLWRTNSYKLFDDGHGGVLIEIGEPLAVNWMREGREATRAEVMESINTGLPLFESRIATLDDAQYLAGRVAEVKALLPAEVA